MVCLVWIRTHDLMLASPAVLPLAIRICIVYIRLLKHVPNFIELLKHKQKVAKHNTKYANQTKVTSQTTMSRVQFVTGILLISFEQKYKQCSAKEAPCNLGPVDGPTILTVIMLLLKGTEHVWKLSKTSILTWCISTYAFNNKPVTI